MGHYRLFPFLEMSRPVKLFMEFHNTGKKKKRLHLESWCQLATRAYPKL